MLPRTLVQRNNTLFDQPPQRRTHLNHYGFNPSRVSQTNCNLPTIYAQARLGTGGRPGTETTPEAAGRAVLNKQHQQQNGIRSQHESSSPSSSSANNKTKSVPSETFINILGMREKVPKTDPARRAQALWDEGCGRRPYDIVSGARLPLPTTGKAERAPGRLGHPSQQSLERGRNLQGSLIPA